MINLVIDCSFVIHRLDALRNAVILSNQGLLVSWRVQPLRVQTVGIESG